MFIQMVQGKCDRPAQMREVVDTWCDSMSGREGWLGGTYGFTDDGTFVGVVRYDSAAACDRLSAAEESAICWAAAQQLCEGRLELHQSEDVTMMMEGGSDAAGFVQVMHGHIRNPATLRHLVSDEMTTRLHQQRPEILGATLAVEPDGSFTQTIAFTDEASARRGEQQEMPEEVRRELESAFADIEYIDLHRPWFATHR
jgi:hypothetical protein